MAKDNEKKLAQSYYIDECLTAKEISDKINVSEKTIGKWVELGNWRELRISKQTTPESLIKKYNELLNILLDKRLESEKRTKNKEQDESENVKSIVDEMSKISAMIDRVQSDGKTSLRTHIHCLEKFMNSLHTKDVKLYMLLIDHQKEYLTILAEELK